MKLTKKENHAINNLYAPADAAAKHSPNYLTDKILQARNALSLTENLTLAAYVNSPEPVATSLKHILEELTTTREALAAAYYLATLTPEPKRTHLQKKSDLLS
jgi:hypothetical protein